MSGLALHEANQFDVERLGRTSGGRERFPGPCLSFLPVLDMQRLKGEKRLTICPSPLALGGERGVVRIVEGRARRFEY